MKKLKGTEKQQSWAANILKEMNLENAITKAQQKTFEESGYRGEAAYERALESLNNLKNLEIEADFVINNRNEHIMTFIEKLCEKYDIKCNFSRLLDGLLK